MKTSDSLEDGEKGWKPKKVVGDEEEKGGREGYLCRGFFLLYTRVSSNMEQEGGGLPVAQVVYK